MRAPSSRHGVLVIDKPQGVTSFDVVAQVRRAFGVRRVGHAGTLDPMATGVLLVCLGEGTKLVPYLMDADKEYRATARLGVSTDTDDAAPGSRVLAQAPAEALSALRPEAVTAALLAMQGERVQRPPRFSALKVDGERLYERARQTLSPEDEAALEAELVAKQRPVSIDEVEVESLALPDVTFRVRCGKGTYIRAMARDLGDTLGVGGHLVALRRLRVGRFRVEEATPLATLPTAPCHSLSAAIAHLPTAVAPAELARGLRQGQRTALRDVAGLLPGTGRDGDAAAALDEEGQLIAVLVRAGDAWLVGRGFQELPA